MNHKEKQSITHYISIRFAAIILIMAAIMILFISYFSNKTIYFDIRRQIRRESRYDFLNIEVRNGKILVDKNFIFRENHVQKLVLDSQGRTIRGHYPDKELNNYPLNQWDFRRVKCSSGYYYIFDRPFLKKDIITNKQILVIIRNIGKETDFNSQYQAMKYISYTFTFVISIIGLLLIGAVSSRLTIPMKEIKDTADTIGIEGNLAKRIESATAFKEMDAMIQANNRMMDRLEDLFHQQQQFTSDVAHELRTPASIISAECQHLKKYGGTINDYMDSLTVIARQNAKTNEINPAGLRSLPLSSLRLRAGADHPQTGGNHASKGRPGHTHPGFRNRARRPGQGLPEQGHAVAADIERRNGASPSSENPAGRAQKRRQYHHQKRLLPGIQRRGSLLHPILSPRNHPCRRRPERYFLRCPEPGPDDARHLP